ncbi:SGNH/GDSL hydrolase family protein [Rheinheimera maricola]|uniref:SGNH/GDSL hydrolase family protein n=1 Tax=Rheinheimera maricola TaxID=2793282 RepID=A0ABS7XAC9_9GAMM|nr:SGNH/GDSL hydrolase family protein [Rheinheimera maricola]MBZ9611742.1 SGNH/GDSL hydrolase family protein [Rheinheimera maricola]
MQSNELGLRSAPIAAKSDNATRVIVLGASSTFGAYARTNSETFPSILQRYNSELILDVINAGIPGNDINNQYKLYEQLLTGLSEDVLILYSGLSNDISRLCRTKTAKKNYSLPQLQAPKWLLTVDLLLKNSTSLRYIPYKYAPLPDLTPYLQQYEAQVQQILILAQHRGVKQILLAENLRSFRPEQPLDLQQELANSALYYTPCLSVAQFSQVFNSYNKVLSGISTNYTNVHYVSLSKDVPGGRRYFVDSVHFSAEGEHAMAKTLAHKLSQLEQLQP